MIDLYKGDFVLAEYEKRFKKPKRFKKIGILTIGFFDVDIKNNFNYVHNGKLCYFKFLEANLPSNQIKYEVREIIEDTAVEKGLQNPING